MTRLITHASVLAVTFGHQQIVDKHFEASCQPPSGTSLTWSNQCAMYPDRWFGLSKDKTDAATAEKMCVEVGSRLVSNWNYELDTCLYDILKSEIGQFTSIDAVIGLKWKPELEYYAWIDQKHNLSSPDAYNTCAGGVCTVEYDDRGIPLESMVASLTDGYYVWQPVGLDALQHYVCELDCEEIVTTTATTRDFNFTTQPTTPSVGANKIAYMSYSRPTAIYVQAVDGDEFTLDNVIGMPYLPPSDMPYLPYMVYNTEIHEFEVVGDWRYPNNFGYHYFIAEDGSSTSVNNSNYDGRAYSTFIYTPELGSIMIGGFCDGYLSSTVQISSNDVTTKLPSIPDAMQGISSVYTNTSVICVGGYGGRRYSTSIYQLDLHDVNNLFWKSLAPLKDRVEFATTAVSGETIFTAGLTSDEGIEQYNIQSQTSTFFSDQFDDDMYMACSIISNGVLTVFGGYNTAGSNTAYQCSDSDNGFKKVTISSLAVSAYERMMCTTFIG